MQSLRHQRVRELLKRQIGEVIRREIPAGETGFITVNDVGVSGDLKSAKVFVGIIGSAAQRQKGLAELNHKRLRIQDLTGRALVLKHTPRLRFALDESIERGNRVLKLLDEIEKSLPSA